MYIDRVLPRLTAEQDDVLYQIGEFLAADTAQVMSVGGEAGTGKSTLLATVAAVIPECLCVAPTGKAADVLRRKMRRRDVTTIHGAIYRLVYKDVDPETLKRRLYFRDLHFPGALRDQIMLVDEASMIDCKMARDLVLTGAKLVLFGDDGQLPPVHGKPYFTDPDCVLQQIHRQAWQSAIIRQAHAVRHTGHYEGDGPEFQVARRPDDDDYLAADAIITFFRRTRQQINNKKRQMLGFRRVGYPEAGEQVLCLMNAPMFGVYNGGVYRTVAPYSVRTKTLCIEVNGREVEIPFCGFTTKDDMLDDAGLTTTFSFGYALTGHKSQGSEWRNVLVVDEYPSQWPDRRRWRYTAFTRASHAVLVVRQL